MEGSKNESNLVDRLNGGRELSREDLKALGLQREDTTGNMSAYIKGGQRFIFENKGNPVMYRLVRSYRYY